jgi:hypothetical protein
MPTTTVKINLDAKQKLDRLQALAIIKGKSLTQQELLSELIKDVTERSDEFVDRLTKDTVPMSNEDYQKLAALSDDWGVSTKWQEIDEILYGSNKKERTRQPRGKE